MNAIGSCEIDIPWPDDNLCRQPAFAFGSDREVEAFRVKLLAPQMQFGLVHQLGR